MIKTPWGYEIDADELPPLITADQLNELTGGAFADRSTDVMVAAVSAAVRSWCGWHIAPRLTCVARVDGAGRILRLPTMALDEIASIEVDGHQVDPSEVERTTSGLVRAPRGKRWPDSWGGVTVTFSSGYDLDEVPDLAAIVAQIAANALVATPGVQSERAGDVQISYNSTAYGVSGGVALLDRDKLLLAPHRLPPVPQ